jgi:hypothetical protein
MAHPVGPRIPSIDHHVDEIVLLRMQAELQRMWRSNAMQY